MKSRDAPATIATPSSAASRYIHQSEELPAAATFAMAGLLVVDTPWTAPVGEGDGVADAVANEGVGVLAVAADVVLTTLAWTAATCAVAVGAAVLTGAVNPPVMVGVGGVGAEALPGS